MIRKISISVVCVYKIQFAINNTNNMKYYSSILDDNDPETQPNINIDNCLLMINNDKFDGTDAYKPNKRDDVKIINNHLQVSRYFYNIFIICLNESKYI